MKPLSDTYEAANILRCAPDQLCEPCQTLLELDAKILETKALLEELEQRRNPTQTQMNQVHDPLIQQVPPEIASWIFTLYVEEGPGCGHLPRPLFLASICKKWREIAFSIPQLWTSLDIFCWPGNCLPVSFTEQWLSRSGQLPLDIQLLFAAPVLHAKDVRSLTDVICAQSHRWNSLELQIPAVAFPVFKADIEVNSGLRDLTITVHGGGSGRFKIKNIILRPQKVWLENISPAHVHIDWINVADFEAVGITWTDTLYALRQNLRIKRLCIVSPPSENIQVPLVPLILPNLEFLEAPADPAQMHQILDFITAPLLRTLKYDLHWNSPQRNLVPMASMLKRSASSLEELCLDIGPRVPINEEDFISLLYDLPSLTSLSLYARTPGPLFSNDGAFIRQFLMGIPSSFEERTAEPVSQLLLPRLKRLEITPNIGISWDNIVAIYQINAELPLTARFDVDLQQFRYLNSMRPLRSLSVRIGHEPWWYRDNILLELIDRDNLIRLFELPKNSMKMKIDTQLMEESIKHHCLTPDKDVLSFYGLGSNV